MPAKILRTVSCLLVAVFFTTIVHTATNAMESPAETVAHMSDEEARQTLVDKLEAEAAASAQTENASTGNAASQFFTTLFKNTEAMLLGMGQQAGKVFQHTVTDDRHWKKALDHLSAGKGGGYLAVTCALIFLCIGVGILCEIMVRRPAKQISNRWTVTTTLTLVQFWGRVLSNLLMEVLYTAVYFITSMIMYVIIFNSGEVHYSMASAYMLVAFYIRLFILVGQIFFSPGRQEIRLIPMNNTDARFVFNWIIAISVVAAVITGTAMIFKNTVLDQSLFQLTYSTVGVAVGLMLAVMIWMRRKNVAIAVFHYDPQNPAETFSAKFGAIWHFFAIAIVIAAGLIWQGNVLMSGEGKVLNLIVSLFVLPVYFVLDVWMVRLINMTLAGGKETESETADTEQTLQGDQSEEVEDKTEEETTQQITPISLLPKLKLVARIVLGIFTIMVILNLWDINLPMGRFLTSRVLSILIIVLLGLAFWQFVKAKIEKGIQAEMPDDTEEKEEGGAGGSRKGTLLVLLRKFIFAVLVVVVGLTVLSSLGVNIAPLIAGAGVFGLAIGFGAQTLVKDILSGVFFLIDDAFRVGDYIEAGSNKGMIEHISLRSLRLRHPRGMVHTIPFGDISTVTNFSRDYIITKLDFRVRYDADVDKIRKIIKKKVNKVILKNEELAGKLLSPIKSQGVRQMDDSAMVMRVKYKSIPGEQFAIRKEVYRLMQEAFHEAGIEFAHRNVTVYLPDNSEQENQELTNEAKTKIAQAGASALAAEEVSNPEGQAKKG